MMSGFERMKPVLNPADAAAAGWHGQAMGGLAEAAAAAANPHSTAGEVHSRNGSGEAAAALQLQRARQPDGMVVGLSGSLLDVLHRSSSGRSFQHASTARQQAQEAQGLDLQLWQQRQQPTAAASRLVRVRPQSSITITITTTKQQQQQPLSQQIALHPASGFNPMLLAALTAVLGCGSNVGCGSDGTFSCGSSGYSLPLLPAKG